MKGLRISIVIAVAALALASGAFGMHDAALKSFSVLSNECKQYLNNDGNGECNVHCVGVVSHTWNEPHAKFTQNYLNFFSPDPEDACYMNRTDRCLQQVYSSVPINEKCLRAQKSGQCVVDQYGELNATRLHYVPMTPLQYSRVLLECADVLGMSDDQLTALAEKGAYNVSDGACLLRCTLLRMGLWSDENGVNLERASAQCGFYGESSEVLACQAKVLAEECDKCVQVKRVAQECLNMHYVVKKDENGSFSAELYTTTQATIFKFLQDSYTGSDAYAGSSSYSSQSSGFCHAWCWYWYCC